MVKLSKNKYTIIFIIFINIILLFFLTQSKIESKNLEESLTNSMRFRLIEKNIVDFQASIENQKELSWSNPFFVIEKLNDIEEGINSTIAINQNMRLNDKSYEYQLTILLKVINNYNKYGDLPNENLIFSTEYIEGLIKLSNDLKLVGWDVNMSYGKNKAEFVESIQKLYEFQQIK